MSILDDIKGEFRKGNMITQLIMVNLAIFVGTILVQLGLAFYYQDRQLANHAWEFIYLPYIAAPFDIVQLLYKPWTLVTSIFLQYNFWHIFWNMVFLFWFGKVLQDYIGSRKILPIYIYGGIAGYVLPAIFYYAFPGLPIGTIILGSSGAVYAIMVALATLVPNHAFHLLLIGPVKIKYIVAFRFLIDLMTLANLQNMGGHIAHIGGGLMGYYIIAQSRKGRDLSRGFNKMFDALATLFKGPAQRKIKVTHRGPKKRSVSDEEYNVNKKAKQEEIDRILDKISKSGYESLSKEEKDTLFKYSKD